MQLLRGTKYFVNEITISYFFFLVVKDVEIDAEDLEYADKQCVVASINFEIFPMSYTFIGRTCEEKHHVICQYFHSMHILFIL